MKNLMLALLAVSVISLLSCSDNELSTAKIQVSLVDAPAEYQAVNIDILEVNINSGSDTSGWVSLESASPGIYDVLKLTNGEEAFMGEVELPEGKLGQVRVVLGDNNSLTLDGETIDLTVPSGSQSGLKINVDADIQAGITYKLVLDFDASKSIVKAGNSGRYNLKPVIRAKMEATTGAIGGIVNPLEAESIVYAVAGEDSVSTYPDETGAFLIRALEAGTYTVTAVVVDTALYQNVSAASVLVEIGNITSLDTLNVSK